MKPIFENEWRQISVYLDEVLDLEQDERQPWIAALQAREPDVAALVRSYLVEIEALEGESFLEDPPGEALAPATLAGQQFGAYTLDTVLGHGGMGTVWLAHRSDGRFEGSAAVKLLNSALVGHPSERRFEREGNVLARLRHPNIAHLLDAGVARGNQPYLIIEYIAGERIDQYCANHRLDIGQRIKLFLDVLAAVAHAHSNLVVHRDLKPSNILVTHDGTVKLLDFGIAALLSPTQDVTLTKFMPAGLTPGYAAPEQLRGEPVTTATDVYALGVVLFILLTSRHPTAASDEASPEELRRRTLDIEAPRLSEAVSDGAQARQLRGDLDNIIAMALHRDPARRYSTAELFAQDLRRCLAMEPVIARPQSLGYVATKFVRRNRVAILAAVSLLAVLVGGIITTTSQMLEARWQRDRARFEAGRAETTNDFLNTLMIADTEVRLARTYRERLELGVNMINKQYRAEDPQFAGRMLVELGAQFQSNEDTQRGNELYDEAYELGRRHKDLELMAIAQCNRAYGDGVADVLEGIPQRIQEAKRLLPQLPIPNPVLESKCLMAEARFELRRDNYETAQALLHRAMRILEQDGSTHRLIYVDVLTELGDAYLAHNELSKSLEMTQLVEQIMVRDGRGGTSSALITRQNQATVLDVMGEPKAALAVREIVNRQVHEIEAPGPYAYSINQASLWVRMERADRAIDELKPQLDSLRKTGNRTVLSYALLSQGTALTQLGRWSEAEAVFSEAAAITSEGSGNHGVGARVEAQWSLLSLAQGDKAAAHKHREKSLELGGYGKANPQRGLGRVLIAAAQGAVMEHAAAEAEQFARAALAIVEPVARGPETSADVGEALLRLAQAQMQLGTSGDATHSALERAVKCLANGLGADHRLTAEARSLLQST